MAWVRLDPAIHRNEKIVFAGRDARSVYIAALCYAARNMTDGRIPKDALAEIFKDAGVDDVDLAVWNLTAVREHISPNPLWRKVQNGYHIHHYLLYYPSNEEVDARRQALREMATRRIAGPSEARGQSATDASEGSER